MTPSPHKKTSNTQKYKIRGVKRLLVNVHFSKCRKGRALRTSCFPEISWAGYSTKQSTIEKNIHKDLSPDDIRHVFRAVRTVSVSCAQCSTALAPSRNQRFLKCPSCALSAPTWVILHTPLAACKAMRERGPVFAQ